MCLHQHHRQDNGDGKTIDRNLVLHQHKVQFLITQYQKPENKKKIVEKCVTVFLPFLPTFSVTEESFII